MQLTAKFTLLALSLISLGAPAVLSAPLASTNLAPRDAHLDSRGSCVSCTKKGDKYSDSEADDGDDDGNKQAEPATVQHSASNHNHQVGSAVPASPPTDPAVIRLSNSFKAYWQQVFQQYSRAVNPPATVINPPTLTAQQSREASSAINQFVEQARIQFEYEWNRKGNKPMEAFPADGTPYELWQWSINHLQYLTVDELVWLETYSKDIETSFRAANAGDRYPDNDEIARLSKRWLPELMTAWTAIANDVKDALTFTIGPDDQQAQNALQDFMVQITGIYQQESQEVVDSDGNSFIPASPLNQGWEAVATYGIQNIKDLRARQYYKINAVFHRLRENILDANEANMADIGDFD